MTPSRGGRVERAIARGASQMIDPPLAGGVPSGVSILTLDGAIPVEFLGVGDRIITRNSGAVTLIAIETETTRTHAVRISANALDHARPERDLLLPASQRVLLRDWRAQVMFGQPQAVAPIGALVDHGFITDHGEANMTLHHLSFSRDQVFYADGLEVLSAPLTARKRAAA